HPDGDVLPGALLDQVAELVRAVARVGNPGDRVLVHDRLQLARVGLANEDLLPFDPRVNVPYRMIPALDPGAAGHHVDIAGDLEQAGDQRGLEGPDPRRPRLEAGQLVAEHVVVLGPPAALAPLAGQLDQRLAFPALNPIQLTQVGNGVAVRLDPFSLFYVIKLACTPVELKLHLGRG